ncbi:tetratricopeptide repeat protein [Methylomonas rhizoryzae]|uniref:hypothetical protein n=1 Tax=Methylomonas rhizoryzae TaxID=2608981 RepID=UPI001E54AF82|nr:hypothetical protein [Methylomonas rhizoryzae]
MSRMTVFDHNLGLRRAEQLNRDCHCVSLSRPQLRRQLAQQPDGERLFKMITEERPHLLSDAAVFVAESSLQRQREIIEALERVIAHPGYRQQVLSYAPQSARFQPKARGVFLGFDFHLGQDGPKLIEINTNAGGALINLLMASAHSACDSCPCSLAFPDSPVQAALAIVAMFRNEWRLSGNQRPLASIAIVDEQPNRQYMLPEFLLFQNLFAGHRIQAVICDPAELQLRAGRLWHGELAIDLVYNRLTDFGLEQPAHRQLLQAYLDQAVVVTPHPHSHALYADKRNLALLTDAEFLRSLGLDERTQAVLLDGVAKTLKVAGMDADSLWQQRKQWFFKPAKGYGSKAAYRGDKLTRRVFGDIIAADYVVQAIVQPSERQWQIGEETTELKLDIRNYVYDGRVQSVCARLYQGQTTNFRTVGGGFANVVVVPERPLGNESEAF